MGPNNRLNSSALPLGSSPRLATGQIVVYPTEINSLAMRTKGAALGASTNWILNLMAMEITPAGVQNLRLRDTRQSHTSNRKDTESRRRKIIRNNDAGIIAESATDMVTKGDHENVQHQGKVGH
ncbi:hypothetical protein BJX63DRAFT_180400 [Aspergillus granulosus]|uniref:Uncharacterized protein n=1 Tax=Aspergillus granulosus TaxID=176169 RepID=A0ABR4I2S6_9EURO